ncbi:MAG: TolC family protein [Pseudomonadota bacterium]
MNRWYHSLQPSWRGRLSRLARVLIMLVLAVVVAAWLPAVAARAEESAAPRRVIGLEEAVRTALLSHPTIRQERSVVEQGRARVERQRAACYPVISGGLSYERVHSGFVGGVRGRAVVSEFSQYTAELTAQQTIYDFGRTSNRVSAARDQLEADRQGLAATEADVAFNAKAAYFRVIQAETLLCVAQESLRRLEQHLSQAQALHEVGLRPKIDVTRAQVDLSSGLTDQITQQGSVTVARASLVNAMGVMLPLDYEVQEIPLSPTCGELAPLVEQALARRPEIKQLQAAVRGLEAQVTAAWSGYLPVLNGSGFYNYSGSGFPLPNSWNVGAFLNVPIFNGFLTRADVDLAKATLRQTQASLDGQIQNVRLEVERAYSDVKTANGQVETQRAAVGQAQENLQPAQARYREGLGSAIEYTDAEVALTSAQANEAQAVYNLYIATAALERAVAGPGSLSGSWQTQPNG